MNLGRHKWLMLACMLAPLAALSAIYLFNVPPGSVLSVGLFLLCPIMHLFMMRGMGHAGHNQGASSHGPACHEQGRDRDQPEPKRLLRPADRVEIETG